MGSKVRAMLVAVLATVLVAGAAVSGFASDGPGGRGGGPPAGVGGPPAEVGGGPSHVALDHQGPIEATHRWALGYDERDLAMMRDTFTDDARFVFYLAEGGDPLVFEGIEAVMGLFESSLASQDDVRRHVTTNHIVEHRGHDRAEVISYLTLLVIDDPTEAPTLQSSGVYTDQMVKGRDGRWRIQERVLRLDTPS